VKLLVITSEPITAGHLREAIGPDATDDAEVLVIAPALHKSALRFWLSDADDAISRAQEVQQESVDQLGDAGVTATGDTGESGNRSVGRGDITLGCRITGCGSG
jgi:hypothetical protein